MSSFFFILFCIAFIALIIFLVVRNMKDEKTFENELNNDYRKPTAEESDADIEG